MKSKQIICESVNYKTCFFIFTQKNELIKLVFIYSFFLSYNIETKVGKIESATFKSHPQHIWFYKYQF